MKASQRLRELEGEAALIVTSLEQPLHAVDGPTPVSVVLRNVLPLIADCIEAAERVYENPGDDHPSFVLKPALTALNDALEESDPIGPIGHPTC